MRSLLFLLIITLSLSSCRNTLEGLERDLGKAGRKIEYGLEKTGEGIEKGVEKTGAGLEKLGEKMQ